MIILRWTRVLLLLAATALLSCSSGERREPSQAGRGQAAAGDALIWLDRNGNFAPDPDEPAGRTAASGAFTLAPLPAAADGTLVVRVEAGRSILADGRLSPHTYLLFAPFGSREISVWTTLVAALATDGQADAEKDVRAAFALPDEFDLSTGEPRSREVLGLGQIVQNAFGQRSALQGSLHPEAGPLPATIAVARDTLDSAPLLLDVARQFTASDPPPLQNPRPVETGLFHGDFAALPINANMAYGIGLDEATYGLKGGCTETQPHFDGICVNDYSYTFDLVETVHELSKHLDVGASASASVSVAGFDVVGVSGGFDFVRDTTFRDNALYILLRVEHRMCGYPVTTALKAPWDELYASNYVQFRQTCGDRYLSSIVSGGRFAALVEVEVDENTKKEEMRLTLAGKVLGATVYKKTWKETLSDIASHYKTGTRVLSNRFTYSDNFLSMTQVFALYDDFAAQMQTCSGPEKCAYLATFSSYAVISNRPPGNADVIRARLATMQSLEAYYFELADLIAAVDDILLHPDDYNIGDSVDAFTPPNDWTIEGLMAWQDEARESQRLVVEQWSSCQQNIAGCPKEAKALGLPTWLESKMELPTRKFRFPETCADLADQFGVTADGERWLFLGGEASRPYRAYCVDMASSAPTTYLRLLNRSADTASPSYNYSSRFYSTMAGERGTVTRIFDALLVEPRVIEGKPYLRVLSGQSAHTEWGAAPTVEGELAKGLSVFHAEAPPGATATANLNIVGTSFVLPPFLEVEVTGEGAVTKERKELSVVVTGGTARVTGDILLEWEEAEE